MGFVASSGTAGNGDSAAPAGHTDPSGGSRVWPGFYFSLDASRERGLESLPKGLMAEISVISQAEISLFPLKLPLSNQGRQEQENPHSKETLKAKGRQQVRQTSRAARCECRICSCSRALTAAGAEGTRAAPEGPAQPFPELESFCQSSLGTSGWWQPGPSSRHCLCQGRAGARAKCPPQQCPPQHPSAATQPGQQHLAMSPAALGPSSSSSPSARLWS